MSQAQETIFNVIFAVAVVYVATYWALAFRLGWLRHSGRSRTAPTTLEFIFGSLGLQGMAFVFSGDHKRVGDRTASLMVVAIRVLLPTVIALTIFANAIS